jgi:hypothetical protein
MNEAFLIDSVYTRLVILTSKERGSGQIQAVENAKLARYAESLVHRRLEP